MTEGSYFSSASWKDFAADVSNGAFDDVAKAPSRLGSFSHGVPIAPADDVIIGLKPCCAHWSTVRMIDSEGAAKKAASAPACLAARHSAVNDGWLAAIF